MPMTVTAPSTDHRGTERGLGPSAPECVVLNHLLDQHPRRLTLGQLSTEVRQGLSGWEVVRAVDNLAAANFLRHEGGDVVPAPAVLRFERLPVRPAPQ